MLHEDDAVLAHQGDETLDAFALKYDQSRWFRPRACRRIPTSR